MCSAFLPRLHTYGYLVQVYFTIVSFRHAFARFWGFFVVLINSGYLIPVQCGLRHTRSYDVRVPDTGKSRDFETAPRSQ